MKFYYPDNNMTKKIDCVMLEFFIIKNSEEDDILENSLVTEEFDYMTNDSDTFITALVKFILDTSIKSKVIDAIIERRGPIMDYGYSPVTLMLDDGTTSTITMDELKEIFLNRGN